MKKFISLLVLCCTFYAMPLIAQASLNMLHAQEPTILGLLYSFKSKEGTFAGSPDHFSGGIYGIFVAVQPYYNDSNSWVIPFNRTLTGEPIVFITSENLGDTQGQLVIPHVNSERTGLVISFSLNGKQIDPKTVSGWFHIVVIGR